MGEPKTSASAAAAIRLMDLANSGWVTQAIHVAAELRLADELAGGPKSAEALAQSTGAHAPSLRRLLRALSTVEICAEREDGSFELLPAGEPLRSDAPHSIRAWTINWGRYLWPIWGDLLQSVKTGQSARALRTGTGGFDHLVKDPERAQVFNQAMVDMTRLVSADVVGVYDFSRFQRVVDVGGGAGQLIAEILAAHPHLRGVLFDLQQAEEAARRHLDARGVADRCELVVGSFFESIPPGADAYVLKSIIHNWNDERALVILRNCRHAMGDGATLLLVERVLPERLDTSAAHRSMVASDLNMLVALGAPERTVGEFASLLEAAGFRSTKIVPTSSTFSVLEALPSPIA